MINCVNHMNRKATQICWNCENWYCDECVRETPFGKLCNNCAPSGLSMGLQVAKKFIGMTLPFIFGIGGGVWMFFGILLFLIAGNPNLLWIAAVGVPGVAYFAYDRISSMKEKKMLPDKEIIKFMNQKSGKLTSKQLSVMASVPEEKANQRLKEMASEGKILFNVLDSGEVVFSKRKLLKG